MYTRFRKYLSALAPFTEAEFQKIEPLLVRKRVRKRQFLLHQGDLCNHVVWIEQGCLRLYLIDQNASEHIISFAFENETLTERISLVHSTPSNYQIDALEDSTVVMIPKEAVATWIVEIPNFAKATRAATNAQLIAFQLRITATLTMAADEKYETLKQLYPNLVSRVPQHMLASYLGVTPLP